MIDNKKIEEAAVVICDYGSVYDSEHRINGFKKGVKWAIETLLQGLRHSADEEPNYDKQITYFRENGIAKTIMLVEEADKYNRTPSQIWHNLCKNFKIVSWIYVEDLFSEEAYEE